MTSYPTSDFGQLSHTAVGWYKMTHIELSIEMSSHANQSKDFHILHTVEYHMIARSAHCNGRGKLILVEASNH